MVVRKSNEFLEASDSEEEQGESGYDSAANEESRGGIGGNSRKRRRIDATSEDDLSSGDDVLPREVADSTREAPNQRSRTRRSRSVESEPDNQSAVARQEQDNAALKRSNPKQVAAAQKAARKSGVVYISRVPPFMKPQTLKHFLAPHAPKGIGRIFLTPEDHAAHTRRVRNGGNKKKSFVDGWVEFASKREAKIAVELLNGNIIGGKKGNFYHDDLWSIKYLNGFKWSHLTEQIANENAERAAKMREEIRRTRQENKAFVADIEKGKMLDRMEMKRKAKGDGESSVGGGAEQVKRARREFKQKTVQKSREHEQPSEQVSRMSKLIF